MNGKPNIVPEILVVDDDRIICLLLKKIFEKLVPQAQILIFHNGKTVLDYLLKKAAPQDILVLLDINMPVMNGWEFLEQCQLQPLCTKLHIAMVTSSINPVDREKALGFPQVDGFYEKPFTIENARKLLGRYCFKAGDPADNCHLQDA